MHRNGANRKVIQSGVNFTQRVYNFLLREQSGFSLIELMVVAVVGLAIALGLSAMFSDQARMTKRNKINSSIASLDQRLRAYELSIQAFNNSTLPAHRTAPGNNLLSRCIRLAECTAATPQNPQWAANCDPNTHPQFDCRANVDNAIGFQGFPPAGGLGPYAGFEMDLYLSEQANSLVTGFYSENLTRCTQAAPSIQDCPYEVRAAAIVRCNTGPNDAPTPMNTPVGVGGMCRFPAGTGMAIVHRITNRQ